MVALDFYPSMSADMSDPALLLNQAGWLRAAHAVIATSTVVWQRTLVACITDQGTILAPSVALQIFELPTTLPRLAEDAPPEGLADLLSNLFTEFLNDATTEGLRHLEAVKDEAEAQIDAFNARARCLLAKTSEEARALRMERRSEALSAAQRQILKTKLDRLADMQNRIAGEMRQRAADLRAGTESLALELLNAFRREGELTHMATVRWRCLPAPQTRPLQASYAR